MEGSILDGDIYPSDDYHLLENGSLFITHVTLPHEHTYRVVVIIDKENGLVEKRDIDVIVFVKPLQNYPTISICGIDRGCLASRNAVDVINCTVSGARPAAVLKWVLREFSQDTELPTNTSIMSEENGFRSTATITAEFNSTVLLVCKSVNTVPLLPHVESFLLIEREMKHFNFKETKSVAAELGSELALECAGVRTTFLTWERKLKSQTPQTIAFTVHGQVPYSKVFVHHYKVSQNGSLINNRIKTEDEGIIACFFEDNQKNRNKAFNVTVFAYPEPTFPVVEGCNGTRYCVLQAKTQSVLKCSLFRIRPLVQLEWIGLTGKLDKALIFSTQRHRMNTNEDGTFDVHSSIDLSGFNPLEKNVSIACEAKAFGSTLSTKIDLVFTNGNIIPQTSATTVPKEHRRKLHFLWIFVPIIAVLITVTVYKLHKAHYANKDSNPVHKQENTPMITTKEEDPKDVQAILMEEQETRTMIEQAESAFLPQPSEKINQQELFVQQLKTKYQIHFEGIRPIPYIREKTYSVNNIFVENPIESFPLGALHYEHEQLKKLKNYHDLLKHETHIDRKIVLGDPGYGKSTLALQMAYDWCTRQDSSPLRNTEILILLRLRQLCKDTSIYKAIKLLLLPYDTTIEELDIKDILQKCSSAVVILDGFDEYPGQDDETLTDIKRIIKGDMFQDFLVVLFTRPSALPIGMPPCTYSTRLSGFDNTSQLDYIRRAVTNNSELCERIRSRLKANPVLGDLCQIPLFFVMFAHMTHENKQFEDVHSVTSFFRHVIKCFHSHFYNKVDEKKVKLTGVFENDHVKLDNICFEGLTKTKRIIWSKAELLEHLGEDFLNHYEQVGILCEEEIFDFELTQYRIEVRFYHKLFCEWFAAHHLSRLAESQPLFSLKKILRKLDLFELHYVFRFACGLNSTAARKIIKHLNSVKDGENFATLCILEQTGKFSDIAESVNALCSKEILLRYDDNRVLQRSIIQLMIVASRNEIPISSLWLRNCFKSVDISGECLQLKTGMILPKLETLLKLHIYSEKSTLTHQDTLECIEYATMSPKIEELCFNLCTLPQTVSSECILKAINEKNISVTWAPTALKTFTLDCNGQWIKKDGTKLSDVEYQNQIVPTE